MSKIKLTGSNSGYVEISSAADAGNLTLNLPTSGTALLSNGDNVYTGITTFSNDLKLEGGSYDVLWDSSDNQLEFGDNAKLSFGGSSDLQIYHDGTNDRIDSSGTFLILEANNHIFRNPAGNEDYAKFLGNGAVELYHNNSKKLETTNTGAIVTGICTATSFSGSGENLTRTTQLSHRNKVINGAMTISQRGSSFTNITGNSGDTYTLDRFKIQTNDLDQAVVTVSQDSSAPDGFSKSLKIQCTTAETSVENYEHARLIYDGEAFDFTDIGFGTSSAKKVTISFWVKSNLTGTWGMNFWRGDANRSNLRTYTINNANTWEHKVITLSPDTTGGVVNSDNGYGLRINWGLATGANFATSHPLDTWHAFQQQYFYPYDARNTNLFSSTSNNFYLTGVQLEVGEQATPFEHRSYGEELARCQRYFQVLSRNTSAGLNSHSRYPALGNGTNSTLWYCYHKQTMRVRPSLVTSNITSTTVEIFNYSTSGGATYGGSSMSEGDENHSQITVTTTGGVSTGHVACWRFKINGDCYWAVDAEL